MVTFDYTPGGVNANSFLSEERAATYFDQRIPLAVPWVASGDATKRLLITATRLLSALSQGGRVYTEVNGVGYYRRWRTWNGVAATTTQRLAFPRTGLLHNNGAEVDSTTIPDELEEATAELAGQLAIKDRQLDNTVNALGVKSVSAGSVSVSFKDMVENKMLPDMVVSLLPPSWLTEETLEPAQVAQFDVI